MSDLLFHLPAERGVIAVSGADRQSFLQGLISNDTGKIGPGQAIYATLLTAQGRFLFDLFLVQEGERYLVDCAADRRADLVKRLSMYRLRAKVAIADAAQDWCVALLFGRAAAKAVGLASQPGAATAFASGIAMIDPRLADLGVRLILPRTGAVEALTRLGATADESGTRYHALRVALGVPDAARDLVPEKSILLENGLDELNAIDWQKGCYMGQELTARTRYRGLVRKRLLPVRIDGPAPTAGTPLLLGDTELGEMRSTTENGTLGLAMVRLEAFAGNAQPVFRAGDARVSPAIPGWMRLPELDEAKAQSPPHQASCDSMTKPRLRDLGISLGQMPAGPLNAITDVAGVSVGLTTIIRDAPAVVRSGVTAIWPSPDIFTDFVPAGFHSFNGNGEMTGTIWLAEQGLLASPICITNTHAVGVARDAIVRLAANRKIEMAWHLPVTAETWDGWLSDAESFPVTNEDAIAALENAKGGRVPEGNVGGGTGMVCHEFKGGTGTASRRLSAEDGGWTVGALVQANYGLRHMLRCGHAPVGLEIPDEVVAVPERTRKVKPKTDQGSIIVILATDAPLLPIQCQRLARRATTGLAWVGGYGSNSSGDIFLAFSTGNKVPMKAKMIDMKMLGMDECSPLFQAAAEATEEAIWNAMIAADTMTGWQGRTVNAIPHDLLKQAVARYARRD